MHDRATTHDEFCSPDPRLGPSAFVASSCVACLNVGVGEQLGAGRLLGSTSAGVGDGGGCCCCCCWFAVMVAVSAVATSPAGTISTSPACGRFRPDVLSTRRRLLRRVRSCSSVAILSVRSCGTRAELVVCGRAVMRTYLLVLTCTMMDFLSNAACNVHIFPVLV